MGLFKNILGSEESLFKNETALSYEFIPKMIPCRETQQHRIASCIRPLFQERDGKHALVYGVPGIGKTVAVKHVFKELEEETEDIIPLYVNCWQKNSSFKILIEFCEILGYKFTQNKRTDELFKVVKQILNKKAAVFCFDEIDKLDDFDLIYSLLEEVYKRSIILITNYKEWFIQMDERIKSRMTPELIEFKPYSAQEIRKILELRADVAFVQGVMTKEALELIAKKTAEQEDVRKGLYLLKESAHLAEDKSSRKILAEHAQAAIAKIEEFNVKSSTDLQDESRFILGLIKTHEGKKIGDLFKAYQDNKGMMTYKTFQRNIAKLEVGGFIETTKTEGGAEGNTTIIHLKKEKKLTDF
ncbi:AAA family ATPase [Candidatus Woesearchaeota archaeon]|nr:AAA family ATPase [Candidatus Woesearchaeota archaeon]